MRATPLIALCCISISPLPHTLEPGFTVCRRAPLDSVASTDCGSATRVATLGVNSVEHELREDCESALVPVVTLLPNDLSPWVFVVVYLRVRDESESDELKLLTERSTAWCERGVGDTVRVRVPPRFLPGSKDEVELLPSEP